MLECLLSFDCLVCLTLCELLCVAMIYKWAFGPTYFECIKIYCGQWGYSYQLFSAHSIIKLFYCFFSITLNSYFLWADLLFFKIQVYQKSKVRPTLTKHSLDRFYKCFLFFSTFRTKLFLVFIKYFQNIFSNKTGKCDTRVISPNFPSKIISIN
jgi:hypothetical protein